jgi:hypothetical protein
MSTIGAALGARGCERLIGACVVDAQPGLYGSTRRVRCIGKRTRAAALWWLTCGAHTDVAARS